MSGPSLIDLTIKYFTRRGYKVKKDIIQEEVQSSLKKFDLVVSKGGEVHPVWVKDWDRTVGVNIVINMDKAFHGAGFSSSILVAEKFSEHAKAYANRKGIKLITKSEIRREIKII